MKQKIIVCINSSWNIYNYRSGLIKQLLSDGYKVTAVAPYDLYTDKVLNLGCRFISFPINSGTKNFIKDIILLVRFIIIFLKEKPQIYLSFTIKPNIYGSFAAHLLGVKVINNITGLGTVFITNSLVTTIVSQMYRFVLSQSKCVFFQNNDDLELFVSKKLVCSNISQCLPGSGIDLRHFNYTPLVKTCTFRFLLIARLLKDKGIIEFVNAARLINLKGYRVQFCLLGLMDSTNPSTIPRSEVDIWISEGIINYLGHVEDVRPEIVRSHCVVLPSYREGTPRSLLEAAAIGRPIITTLTAGCQDVVDDGKNGFLCRLKDIQDLSDKMETMINIPFERLEEMGLMGRKKVEAQYSEEIVVKKYSSVIRSIY